jgi:hypothetical protein
MALNAAGICGVPGYTAVLARSLREVSPEFPDLQLVLVTTAAGVEAAVGVELRGSISSRR